MAEISTVSDQLFILDSFEDVLQHTLQMTNQAQCQLRLLSAHLDVLLYDNQDFTDALSALARKSRYTDIRIIVKDMGPLVEQSHRLLRLSTRLPSKITIRHLSIEPENNDMTILLIDDDKILYRSDEREYKGFANYDAGPEVKNFAETFARLWQHSDEDPQLRKLNL